jgi:phage baseplate assembly protein W
MSGPDERETPAAREGFLGRGWGFPPAFSRTGVVRMVGGVDDVHESLGILLGTQLGERIMRPEYGCDLRQVLFEDLDASAVAYLRDLVRTAVLYHEPRVRLEQLTLTPLPLEGRVDIAVEYVVRATNSRHNYVYPFYLREGTNVRR